MLTIADIDMAVSPCGPLQLACAQEVNWDRTDPVLSHHLSDL